MWVLMAFPSVALFALKTPVSVTLDCCFRKGYLVHSSMLAVTGALFAFRCCPRAAEVAEFGSGGTAFLSTPSIFFSLDKDLRAKCKVFDVSFCV